MAPGHLGAARALRRRTRERVDWTSVRRSRSENDRD